MSATLRLSQHVVETAYQDLPAQVILKAKQAIRDSLGCLLGGATIPAGRQLIDLMMPMAGAGQATVAGRRQQVVPSWASYINAQLANLLDYDDTLEGEAVGHPGATVVPAALALAEHLGSSGQDFLTAVVVGYDVFTRVFQAGRPSFQRTKQVRGMATWQTMGAAAASAHLLTSDPEVASRAFGLAALHAPVPFVGKIYEERPMWALKNNFGWATMGGVLGALFAVEGLDANHAILEGESGFWAMAGSDQSEPAMLTEALGSRYSILDVSFKPYPCCRFTHTTLDAIFELIRSAGIQAHQVRSVRVRSSSKIAKFADYRPQSLIDSQFSLPYLVAMALLGEPPGYGWIEGDRWQDPDILALADRVDLEVDGAAEGDLARGVIGVKVWIELDNQEVLEGETTYARGHPRNPLTDRELTEKFLSLAEPALGLTGARQLSARIEQLEQLASVTELTALLI